MHDYLKELGSRFEIPSSVSIFDQVIPSHPDVIGYIEISGEKESLFSLEAMANAVIIDCYPISKFTINSSSHYGDEISSLVKK